MGDYLEAAAVVPAGNAVVPDRPGSGREERRQPPPQRKKAEEAAGVVDVASVLGMPPEAVPPAIQAAVAALVEEVERLRAQLEQARHVEAFLAMEADRHPFLPVLNRRALLPALERLIDTAERMELPGTLAYLHIGGLERLRVVHGLAACDAALAQVAEVIRAELRQTDLVAYLDGGDFCVVLAVAGEAGAAAKAREIVVRLSEVVFRWQGRAFLFTVALGLAHFRPGVTGEGLLAAADAARRQGAARQPAQRDAKEG